MTWRVLRIEMVRGAAPVAAAGVLLAGLLVMSSLAGGWAGWPGRWMPFAVSVRMSLFVLGAFAVAAAAWQAGRERRRHIDDQLTSAARPGWQPFLIAWGAVTLGVSTALLVVVGAGAALVAPVASYAGGGWWWVLAVAFPALATLTALGAALGRLIPSRLTAPVAAIALYLTMVGAIDTYGLGVVLWLAPVMSQYDGVWFTLAPSMSLYQTLWFVGLAATALLLAAARRVWLAAIPAGVAVVAVVFLEDGFRSAWQEDDAALELVCTEDAGPGVCVTQLNAFLLDDVTPPVREILARSDGVPGGPTHAVEGLDNGLIEDPYGASSTAMSLRLDGATLTGRLVEAGEHGSGLLGWSPPLGCGDDDADYRVGERHHLVLSVASAWGIGEAPYWMDADVQASFEALTAMPEGAQKDWMGRLLEAAASCDEPAMRVLEEALR
jgi:hypothetical protein